MKLRVSLIADAQLFGCSACQNPQTEIEYYPTRVEQDELFHEVQMEGVFPDSKTFADFMPKSNLAETLADYHSQKNEEWFNLSEFVNNNFNSPFQAKAIAIDWLSVNNKVYSSTGKMMVIYNVADTTLLAGGGEYPTKDGYGWTNGIALGLDADVANY